MKEVEPSFGGVKCNGPDHARADALKGAAEARMLLSDFYRLERHDQLIMAAMFTEMCKDRGETNAI